MLSSPSESGGPTFRDSNAGTPPVRFPSSSSFRACSRALWRGKVTLRIRRATICGIERSYPVGTDRAQESACAYRRPGYIVTAGRTSWILRMCDSGPATGRRHLSSPQVHPGRPGCRSGKQAGQGPRSSLVQMDWAHWAGFWRDMPAIPTLAPVMIETMKEKHRVAKARRRHNGRKYRSL